MHSRLNRWTACSKFVFNSIRFLEWNDKVQDDVKEKCCWKIKRIFKNSKQKFIQTLWSTCLHKSCRYLISTVSTYSSWTIMRMKMQTWRKIFDQLSKISFAKKRHALNKYARAQMKNLVVKKREATLPHRIQHVRHRASSITTDSKMASRSTGQSSDHHRITEKEKRGREKKERSLRHLWQKDDGIETEELAVRKKIDRSRSRFGREDGSTSPSDPASRMVAHASMAAFLSFLSFLFFFFFPPFSLPRNSPRPTLSRTARGPSILS